MEDESEPVTEQHINDHVVLITGGTSALGRALLVQLLEDFSPKKVIVFARHEDELSEMQVCDCSAAAVHA